MKKKIVLYGIGFEGEKFYWKWHNEYEFMFCIDMKGQSSFHGINVYSLTEKVNELKKYKIIITPVGQAYKEIKELLINEGLEEFKDFINSRFIGRELAVLYGNCHMGTLNDYFVGNCYFSEKYVTVYHYIGENDAPSDNELQYCKVLIMQDIRDENEFDMPSAQTLKQKCNKDIVCFIIPNLYGCNLFFPQCYFPEDNRLSIHLGMNAFDVSDRSKIEQQRIRVTANSIGKRDFFIDKMVHGGASISEIEDAILNSEVFAKNEIISNYNSELQKLKNREKHCDIKISDYIEERYRKEQVFYEPFHPCENVVMEKGRRILKCMGIPIDEVIPLHYTLGSMEMPIYGCVRKALEFEWKPDKYIRRVCSATLGNKPETLHEYIENYIKWVWETDI